MYQGLDKSGGGLVGSNSSASFSADFIDVCDVSSAEEILVCVENDESGESRKVFVTATLNVYNGSVCWNKNYDEEKVMRRTIGMSQMTSMLHDIDRNGVYERSIAVCIRQFIKRCGRPPTVLDIGTGTGLLAMMCVRHGASYVIGCEMFEAMAEVARDVIRHNGMDDRILVVSAKSCDIDSLPFQPDIIISELLDSALLGEGVVFSHADAIERFVDAVPLPTSDSTAPENDIRLRVLPYAATVFGALVESTELLHMTSVDSSCLGGCSTIRGGAPASDPISVGDGQRAKCPWGRMLPVHWETQLHNRGEGSKVLSDSVPLLQVEFFHTTASNALSGGCKTRLIARQKGIIHGLLVWWKADLLAPELVSASNLDAQDELGECRDKDERFSYSTEPGASHCWQDHWQQTVFPLAGHTNGYACEAGDVMEVTTSHDGLHVWCTLTKISTSQDHLGAGDDAGDDAGDVDEAAIKKPRLAETFTQLQKVPPTPFEDCHCGWHLLCGPERMLQLSDKHRMQQWQLGVTELVSLMLKQPAPQHTPGATPLVLDVSDGSTLAFMAAVDLAGRCVGGRDVSGRVVTLERKPYSALFYHQLVMANSTHIQEDSLIVLDEDAWGESWIQGGGECPVWEEEPDNDKEEQPIPLNYVAAVVCECFFYQLHSLPLQSALSFYYAVNGIKKCVQRPLQICPRRARVVVAAFELTDLHVSHGTVGIVNGFDHSPLDLKQSDWHTHWFPYKMGCYRKTLLTEPVCVAVLDYAGDAVDGEGISVSSLQKMPVIVSSGRCDCLVMWVDYDISDGNIMSFWDGVDFPSYLKTSVKFLENPIVVASGNSVVELKSSFNYGNSEMEIDARIIVY